MRDALSIETHSSSHVFHGSSTKALSTCSIQTIKVAKRLTMSGDQGASVYQLEEASRALATLCNSISAEAEEVGLATLAVFCRARHQRLTRKRHSSHAAIPPFTCRVLLFACYLPKLLSAMGTDFGIRTVGTGIIKNQLQLTGLE
ncbi:hypothetical protein BX070DRAFT_84823 [Coemansia spiralis]|nr:hypothetical protein BX070DRAFT_84823 [Coemansia spiralis]